MLPNVAVYDFAHCHNTCMTVGIPNPWRLPSHFSFTFYSMLRTLFYFHSLIVRLFALGSFPSDSLPSHPRGGHDGVWVQLRPSSLGTATDDARQFMGRVSGEEFNTWCLKKKKKKQLLFNDLMLSYSVFL